MGAISLDRFKDISIIVGGVIAFITLWQGMLQYGRQLRFIKVNQFIDMRRRFLEDQSFRRILSLVWEGSPAVAAEPVLERRNLAGFFEELALMMNSGVLKPEVIYYMYGNSALKLDECKGFWHGLDRDSPYWKVFHEFIADLRRYEKNELPRKRRDITI